MTLVVRLFARCRDLAGADRVTIDVGEKVQLRDVRTALARQFPALAGFLPRCAMAVNDQFANDDVELTAGSEVAVIPPVSGG